MQFPVFYHDHEELRELVRLCDAIEVSPVKQETIKGKQVCEPCADAEAHFYSVYAHYDVTKTDKRGVECIGDFYTHHAATIYAHSFSLPVNQN